MRGAAEVKIQENESEKFRDAFTEFGAEWPVRRRSGEAERGARVRLLCGAALSATEVRGWRLGSEPKREVELFLRPMLVFGKAFPK